MEGVKTSYHLLESVRLAVVANIDTQLVLIDPAVYGSGKIQILSRVYPEETKVKERLSGGQYPLLTFAMLDEAEDACGRILSRVQFDIIHREMNKKTLWDVHHALQKSATPVLIQAQVTANNLPIRVALFRQVSEDDTIYDDVLDTYRLRSEWTVRYVRL